MLRPYMPHWIKSEKIEFVLECASALAFGFAVVNYLLGLL